MCWYFVREIILPFKIETGNPRQANKVPVISDAISANSPGNHKNGINLGRYA